MAVAAAATTVVASLVASPAQASTVTVVAPGQSIQAAVDAAHPGDTIQLLAGTYHESVTISTDNVTLRGAGSGANGTVLLPPAAFPDNACGRTPPAEEEPKGGGICIYGIFDDHFVVTHQVTGVRVTGIRVSGFAIDVQTLFAQNTRIDHVAALNAGHYGIAAIISQHLMIDDNVLRDAGHAALYVGNYEVAGSDTTITHNEVANGYYGLAVRDSQGVTVTENYIHDNCSGYFGWDDTIFTQAPGGDQILVARNVVANNNATCAPDDPPGFPQLHGSGILLTGNKGTTVRENAVTGNVGTGPLAGGIVVSQQPWIPPTQLATGNLVTNNVVAGNGPYDVRWDQLGTGNTFTGNVCASSSPGGLCR